MKIADHLTAEEVLVLSWTNSISIALLNAVVGYRAALRTTIESRYEKMDQRASDNLLTRIAVCNELLEIPARCRELVEAESQERQGKKEKP